MEKVILKIVQLYQKTFAKIWHLINPHYGCKFYPSCSEYFCQAVKKYGLIKGLFKGAWRILRCNPFNGGGIDLC